MNGRKSESERYGSLHSLRLLLRLVGRQFVAVHAGEHLPIEGFGGHRMEGNRLNGAGFLKGQHASDRLFGLFDQTPNSFIR